MEADVVVRAGGVVASELCQRFVVRENKSNLGGKDKGTEEWKWEICTIMTPCQLILNLMACQVLHLLAYECEKPDYCLLITGGYNS